MLPWSWSGQPNAAHVPAGHTKSARPRAKSWKNLDAVWPGDQTCKNLKEHQSGTTFVEGNTCPGTNVCKDIRPHAWSFWSNRSNEVKCQQLADLILFKKNDSKHLKPNVRMLDLPFVPSKQNNNNNKIKAVPLVGGRSPHLMCLGFLHGGA